jgi:hypothetical protein
MTQFTDEQMEQVQALASRVAGKFQSFYETLPADEQGALEIALRRAAPPGDSGDDTVGYAANEDKVRELLRDLITLGLYSILKPIDVGAMLEHAEQAGGR